MLSDEGQVTGCQGNSREICEIDAIKWDRGSYAVNVQIKRAFTVILHFPNLEYS